MIFCTGAPKMRRVPATRKNRADRPMIVARVNMRKLRPNTPAEIVMTL